MPFSSKIANDLLWSPFDNKSVNPYGLFEKVTSEEFLNECFSEPIFKDIIITEADGILYNDLPETKKERMNKIKNDAKKYETFNDWFEMFENHKVYTISGNSGTGKTTFLHYLKHTIKKYEWTIIDVANAQYRFNWFGDTTTTISCYSRATRKTFAAIVKEIYNIIFNLSKSPDMNFDKTEIIYRRLSFITKRYIERFSTQHLPGCSLLNSLVKIFDKKKYIKTKKEKTEKVEKASNEFAQFFENSRSDDDYQLLDKAMDVLLLLLRCMDETPDRKHIIAFDNFERFISQDEIYNSEINDMRKKLAVYDMEINQYSAHGYKVKFIMAIRCTTARICGIKLDPADENPSNIDISTWFNINDIIYKKINFLKKYGIIDKNHELAQFIAGDLRKCNNDDLTGLQLFLSPLFNDNKRLIIDFLGMMIEDIDNSEGFDYMNIFKLYEENWEINTRASRCASRNLIKGAILYKLKNADGLFKNLKVVKEQQETNEIVSGAGLVRRILTIIYNRTTNSRTEIPLSTVIEELYAANNIFDLWQTNEYKDKRKDVAEVLFYMLSYNRRDNDWVQFVDLQHDNTLKKLKINDTQEMETMLYNELGQLKIAIMPAGIVFLKYIVASFEYFSVRYNKEYLPLFATVPSVATMTNIDENEITTLKCYMLINNVKKRAFECMNNIHDNNIRFRAKNNELLHSDRIKSFHHFYLTSFISYIKELYLDNPNISADVKDKYLLLIDKIYAIKEEYKSYVPNR